MFPPVYALCHGNLGAAPSRRLRAFLQSPHSGIHDVSGSCAKAFLRLLSDSSTQELHCRDEKISVGEGLKKNESRDNVYYYIHDMKFGYTVLKLVLKSAVGCLYFCLVFRGEN